MYTLVLGSQLSYTPRCGKVHLLTCRNGGVYTLVLDSQLSYTPMWKRVCRFSCCGGDKRDRTADLLNAIQALSQLSYTPRCGPAYRRNS